MKSLAGKRILFLGATVFFYDAAKYAMSEGAYVIAIDYYSQEKAVTKQIVNEAYDIDITDVDKVCQLIREKEIDGVYAGASEVSIPVAIEVSKRTGLPFYCNEYQWEICTNKRKFKEMCQKHSLKVTPVYSMDEVERNSESLEYPLVTKPVDNNGSTGISICKDQDELSKGIKKAYDNSKCKDILIEKYMPYDSVIVHYTAQNGEIIFSGLSDKKSRKLQDDSAPVMALQLFPSRLQGKFLQEENENVISMLKDMGVKNGPIWMEIFVTDHQDFIFNEIGYRYGGSLTYFAVEFLCHINQMRMLLHYAVGNEICYSDFSEHKVDEGQELYAIVPLHLRPGKISQILGISEVERDKNVRQLVTCHVVGDDIGKSGTVAQVFGYLHVSGKTRQELKETINRTMKTLKVYDEDGRNCLYSLYNDEML